MVKELTYKQVAATLGFSVRQAKRILIAHRRMVQPLRYSYKTVRFPAGQILALKRKLRKDAVQRARTIKFSNTAKRAEAAWKPLPTEQLARQGMK